MSDQQTLHQLSGRALQTKPDCVRDKLAIARLDVITQWKMNELTHEKNMC